MADMTAYKKIISDIIPGQTQDDLDRAMADGFLAVRDDSGKLIFRYHPILNQIEIKYRRSKVIISLNKYRTGSETVERIYQESAKSAAQQGGVNGGRDNL